MCDLVKYICIGVPLYLGTAAALLVILGANRDRHDDEFQSAIDKPSNPADENQDGTDRFSVWADKDSTHADHIVIHPVDSQCDGADTVISKESCLNNVFRSACNALFLSCVESFFSKKRL